MTSAKSVRTRRRRMRQDNRNADLEVLDPDSPFRKKVEELRAFVDGHDKPVEDWDTADHEELVRRSDNDFLAIGLAVAAPGGTTATSENPHGPYGDQAW